MREQIDRLQARAAGAEEEEEGWKEGNKLHYAVSKGDTAGVLTLLQKKASLDDVDNKGKTPLHLAVQGKHFEVAQILLDAGAPVNIEDLVENKSPMAMSRDHEVHEQYQQAIQKRNNAERAVLEVLPCARSKGS